MPGAIAATPVEAPIDVEEGTLPADVPLVYYYGHSSPSESPELYTYLVERLAAVLERRVLFCRFLGHTSCILEKDNVCGLAGQHLALGIN